MGIEIKTSQHVKHTEISIWTQINIYTEVFSVFICPETTVFSLVSTITIESKKDLCVFNMLACLTLVSLCFSAIYIPMF